MTKGRTQRKLRRKGQRRRSVKGLWIGLGLLAGVVFFLLIGSSPRLPKVGDHWHAQYEIILCGEHLPPLPYTQGNIHTHGDGQIHIHPKLESEAGANANLGRFFADAGLHFDQGTIRLPGGRTLKNGDPCPDGRRGQLHLIVNGQENSTFEKYVPQDGDLVRIEFRPEGP